MMPHIGLSWNAYPLSSVTSARDAFDQNGLGVGPGVAVGAGVGNAFTRSVTDTIFGEAVIPACRFKATLNVWFPVTPLSEIWEVGTESYELRTFCGPERTTIGGVTVIPVRKYPEGIVPLVAGKTATERDVMLALTRIVTVTDDGITVRSLRRVPRES